MSSSEINGKEININIGMFRHFAIKELVNRAPMIVVAEFICGRGQEITFEFTNMTNYSFTKSEKFQGFSFLVGPISVIDKQF